MCSNCIKLNSLFKKKSSASSLRSLYVVIVHIHMSCFKTMVFINHRAVMLVVHELHGVTLAHEALCSVSVVPSSNDNHLLISFVAASLFVQALVRACLRRIITLARCIDFHLKICHIHYFSLSVFVARVNADTMFKSTYACFVMFWTYSVLLRYPWCILDIEIC